MTTILYRPRDLSLSSDTERSIYFDRLESLLRSFGTNWHLLFDSHTSLTETYPRSIFTSPASAFVDAEHADTQSACQLQETSYYLTITQTIPRSAAASWFDTFLGRSKAAQSSSYDADTAIFVDRVQVFTNALALLFPYAALATSDQLCTYLHSTVSWYPYKVRTPEYPVNLAHQLTDTAIIVAYTPALGTVDDNGTLDGNYIRPLTIKAWPESLESVIPSALQHLSFPYRLSVKWSPLDFEDAISLTETITGKWESALTKVWQLGAKVKNTGETDNTQDTQVTSAKQVRHSLDTRECALGYLTSTVLVYAPTTELLTTQVREVRSLLQSSGCVFAEEDVGAAPAFVATLPGNYYHDPTTIPSPSPAPVFLCPHTSIWSGSFRDEHYNDNALFVANSDGVPFGVPLHPENSELGSLMLVGPSRSGKTGKIGFMMSQFNRYKHSQIFCFDKDYQLYGTTLLHSGKHYDLCTANSHSGGFSILRAVSDSEEERTWCLTWLTHLFTHQNMPPTPDEKASIWSSLTRLAQFPPHLRTLTNFGAFLASSARRLLPALRPFLKDGPYGFFDAADDTLDFSHYTTFEMRHLLDRPEALPHALRYMFHRIAARFTGQPTLIVLTECRKLLADPTFGPEILDYLKERAKLNVAVILETQEIADAMHTPLWQAIKGSVKTWIYTPNDKAEDPSVALFYEDCGLTATHRAVLARSTPTQDYLYQSEAGMRRYQLSLSPLERLMCAASKPHEIAEMKNLVASPLTESLPAAWLRLKGYPHEADIYEEFYATQCENSAMVTSSNVSNNTSPISNGLHDIPDTHRNGVCAVR
jgi:type IV secretion system protein VirB4